MDATVDAVALVRLAADYLDQLPGCGPWWLVLDDGRVMVPLCRDGDGGRAIGEGAKWVASGGHVLVDHLWLMARRRGAEAAALRRAVDRVLAVARKRRA